MTDPLAVLAEIRNREQAATPGPWRWFGNTDAREVYLATAGFGRMLVMRFARWGMRGAQPVFYPRSWKPNPESVSDFTGTGFPAGPGDLPVYEVAPQAESRDDPRVYRADIAGIRHPDAEFIARAREDVPRLLAGLEAALRFHDRVGLYGNAATEEEPGNCPHHPDSDLHFEDADGSGEWLCEGRPEGAVCSSCTEDGERMEWPCPEYESIIKAVSGKGANGG
jgi:hypothetical protein